MTEQEVKTKWADMDYVKLSYGRPLDPKMIANTITMVKGEAEDAYHVKGYWQDRRWGCESCGMVAIRVPMFHVDTQAGAYLFLAYQSLARNRIRVQWSDASKKQDDRDAPNDIMGILYPDADERSLARSIAGMETAIESLKRTMDGTKQEPQNSEITVEPLKEEIKLRPKWLAKLLGLPTHAIIKKVK